MFSFASSSSTASLNVPNIFVTSTDMAIVDRDVSSRFLLMTPIPLHLLAVLK